MAFIKVQRFPDDKALESWALVYPHYWDEKPSEDAAQKLLKQVKAVFCASNAYFGQEDAPLEGTSGPLLDGAKLTKQFPSFFSLVRRSRPLCLRRSNRRAQIQTSM